MTVRFRSHDRLASLLVGGLAAAVLLAGCSDGPATPALESQPTSEPSAIETPVDGIDYVALGDSFSSGPLIPLQRNDASGCFRSTNNYPAYVAQLLDVQTYRDATCAGAVTADLSPSVETRNQAFASTARIAIKPRQFTSPVMRQSTTVPAIATRSARSAGSRLRSSARRVDLAGPCATGFRSSPSSPARNSMRSARRAVGLLWGHGVSLLMILAVVTRAMT